MCLALMSCENCAQNRAERSEPPCHFEWKPRSFSLHQPWRFCAPAISTTCSTRKRSPQFSWQWNWRLPTPQLTEARAEVPRRSGSGRHQRHPGALPLQHGLLFEQVMFVFRLVKNLKNHPMSRVDRFFEISWAMPHVNIQLLMIRTAK